MGVATAFGELAKASFVTSQFATSQLARCYYDTFGKDTIGDKCSPAYSGGEGCLRLDKNKNPRWYKCKASDSQNACQWRGE